MIHPITPFLWYNLQAEEAIAHYTSAFASSSLDSVARFPSGPLEGPMQGLEDKVMTGAFTLAGRRIMAFDGGPHFTFTPAISLFVTCETVDQIDALWASLGEGGSVMMELGSYPFSERFGWLADKYGLSWQLHMGGQPTSITPALMFTGAQFGRAEEAMRFYTSLFDQSEIVLLQHGTDAARGDEAVQQAIFTLQGQPFMAMDSGYDHGFGFNEAVSLYVECDTQEEIDFLWDKLSADPAAEACGWLKDQFGVSWQITPTMFNELYRDPNSEGVQRAMAAMMEMKKLDIAALERAFAGA